MAYRGSTYLDTLFGLYNMANRGNTYLDTLFGLYNMAMRGNTYLDTLLSTHSNMILQCVHNRLQTVAISCHGVTWSSYYRYYIKYNTYHFK